MMFKSIIWYIRNTSSHNARFCFHARGHSIRCSLRILSLSQLFVLTFLIRKSNVLASASTSGFKVSPPRK